MRSERFEKDKRKIGYILKIVGFTFLCVFCGVFAYVCLTYYTQGFIAEHFLLLFILAEIVIFTAFIAGIIFIVKSKKQLFLTLYKALLGVLVLIALILFVLFILQKTGFLSLINDPERYKEYLSTTGAWMPFVYVLIQYLQVVVLPIPSVVTTVAGVVLFGPFLAAIYSFLGIVFGSITAFFVGRKLGVKAAAWTVGEETLRRWQEKLKGKDNFILTAMLFLPMFPDDVLCFVAGLSSMSNAYFIIIIILARAVGVFGTCYSFNFIPFNTWWGICVWVAIIAAIILLFLIVYKNTDKINSWIEKHVKKHNNNG